MFTYKTYDQILPEFLPERDYVTFGSLLLQIRLLSLCNVVDTTQGLKHLAIFLHCCVPWPWSDFRAKFHRDRPRGTTPSEALNTGGAAK